MDQEKIESRSQQGPVVGKGMNGKGNSRKYSGRGGRGSWTKGSSKNGGNISEMGKTGHARSCWYCERTGHMVVMCTKGSWNNNLYPVDEQENGSNNVVHDTDGDVQTWCILGRTSFRAVAEVITKKLSENNRHVHRHRSSALRRSRAPSHQEAQRGQG